MPAITMPLSDEQLERLGARAREAGVSPEEFVRASLEAWLDGRDRDFANAARRVLHKNAELYRSLG